MRKRTTRGKKMRRVIYLVGGALFLETLCIKYAYTRQNIIIKLGHLSKGFLNVLRLIIDRLDLILATVIEESIWY